MTDLDCESGSAIEYKVRRDGVQFRPQSQLRLRQDVQTGLEVCLHISVRPEWDFSGRPIRCPSPRLFRNSRPRRHCTQLYGVIGAGNAGCILMGMTFAARYFVIASLICGMAAAQDVSGRWGGVADTTDEGNTRRQEPQSFEVKIADGKLTAVSIGKDGKPGAALKIEQDGAKVNLYRFLDFEGGEHLRWKVELKGDKLVGIFSALHDDPKKWVYDRSGAITLSRVDTAASSDGK
jgi:hypothetical protein